MSVFKYAAASALVGALSVLALNGCSGAKCGDGATEKSGTCTAAAPLDCEPGTHDDGSGRCVGPGFDGGGGVDGPVTDGPGNPDVPVIRGCKANPSICSPPLTCDQAMDTCVPPSPTNTVPVTDVQRGLLPLAIDPALVIEGDKLMLYYQTVGGPAGNPFMLPDALSIQTNGAVMQQGVFSAAKVEVNPTDLTLVGNPTEITELKCGDGTVLSALSPGYSADGLWMIFGCYGACFGGPQSPSGDLCVASRTSNTDPWGNVRWMSEVSTPKDDSDPAFRSDPTTGSPLAIYWTTIAEGQVAGGSTVICTYPFDPSTGMATGVMTNANGTPICNTFQASASSTQIAVSDSFAAENCAEWSSDGHFFAWARNGLGTAGFDFLMGKSNNADGVVNTYVGQLGVNTTSNELGITFAPFQGNFKGIIAWSDVPDLVTYSVPSTLGLARIDFSSL
jgi:hypothetical protein